MKAVAIIPAAGEGTRMRTTSPKQFLSLAGVPILVHTLRKFSRCSSIGMAIVPMRKSDIASPSTECRGTSLLVVYAMSFSRAFLDLSFRPGSSSTELAKMVGRATRWLPGTGSETFGVDRRL